MEPWQRDLISTMCDEAMDILSSWETSCIELRKGHSTDQLDSILRAAHNLKGGAHTIGLTDLGLCIHGVEDSLLPFAGTHEPLSEAVIDWLLECHSFICQWFEELRDNPETSVPETLWPKLLRSGEEVSPASHEVSVSKNPIASEKKAKSDETVRVSAQKLDFLLKAIGELAIQHSIISHAKSSEHLQSRACHNAIALSQKLIKEIQLQAFSLRMQPVGTLFHRLERVALDLARELDKSCSVVFKGENVELDKTIVEKTTDALVHLLRNALDHGIEGAAERLGKGKKEEATIVLEAIQNPSTVTIILSDDGRGLNTEKILHKAQAKGLISAETVLSPKEIHALIFEPGFSTADEVSEISGRGIGMDVVKKTVEQLGGCLDLSSERDKGTIFEITLPTTVSILNAFVVKLGLERYVIPIQDIGAVVDLQGRGFNGRTNDGQVLQYRGHTLPLKRLSDYLPLYIQSQLAFSEREIKAPPSVPGRRVALISHFQGRAMAFEVDGIVTQTTVVVRPLNSQMEKVHGLSGSTILGDGEPCAILDLYALTMPDRGNLESKEVA